MKRFNKLIMGALLVTAIGSGCNTDKWLDINKDPNNPVESNISPDLVMPSALLNTANRTATGYGFLGNWIGYWCPAANYAPSTEEQSYNISTGFGAGIFSGLMDNSYDYEFMEKRAVESKQTYYVGIAKIMKALNFTQLVDVYDNVPYSESLKGLSFVRPKYDDAKTIYEESVKQIDTGIAMIKAAVESENLNIVSADVLFHADKTMWVKFANTLKLRLLMHQANRADRATYITAEMAKIAAEGSGFLGSGQDAAVNPIFQSDKPNQFYANYGFTQTGTQATDFWRANIIAMNFLKNNNDPRLGLFYKPIVASLPGGASEPFSQPTPNNYRGNQYGLGINNVTFPYQTANYVSQVGGIAAAGAGGATSTGLVKGYAQTAWLITSVESLFLQAEATQRGFLAGNAENAYKAAVLESFKWLNAGGSSAAATTAFNTWYNDQVTANNVNVSWAAATVNSTTTVSATSKLGLIAFQKYLALNGTLHLEAWTDYRRNGNFPVIPLSVNPGRTSPTLPYRLLYPQAELNLNTANVPQLGRKAGDQFAGKIWWMN